MPSPNITSITNIQSVHHLSLPCPVRIPPLLLMANQYSILPALILSEYHLSHCPRSASTQFLLPMASQNTIFPIHVQSVHFAHICFYVQLIHYLSCSCPVGTPSPLLAISSQHTDTTSSAKVQSVHHFIWPSPVRIPPFLSISKHHALSTAHFHSS